MRTTILFLLILKSTLVFSQLTTGIYINEIMSNNKATILDETGDSSDWIELYNSNSVAVDLAGYYLTDDLTNPTKFQLSTTPNQNVIPAGGYLILWASGQPSRGVKHLSFSLSSSGESAGLYAPNGTTLINSVTFGALRPDISYGRLPNGASTFKLFSPASPLASNNASNAYTQVLKNPLFSKKGGFYINPFSLTISSADAGVTIYYTTDGSEPSPDNITVKSYSYRNVYPFGSNLTRSYKSNLYTSPISVTDRSSQPNQISGITTSAQDTYTPPSAPIFKSTVIRARAFKAGYLPSDIITNSYFFTPTGTNKYVLPVISIATQEDNLFSYTKGIYTPGIDFDQNVSNGNYWRKGSTAQPFASFELIETDTAVVNRNITFGLHGRTSRQIRMKSLNIYTDSDNGTSDLNYQIFKDLPDKNFKSFILRNAGQDFGATHFCDAAIQKTVEHLNIDTQNYRASIVFLNGEYWGIHNIREKYDKDYYNRVYGVNGDNMDLLELPNTSTWLVHEGDVTNYNSMINYITSTGLHTAAQYDSLNKLIDINNFMNFQITNIFYSNTDWPVNNTLCWREKVPYNPNANYGRDGRWRWSLVDLDVGLGRWADPSKNMLDLATDNVSFSYATTILRYLIYNPVFKVNFINHYADLLNTAFLSTRVIGVINQMKTGITSQMPEHITRWSAPPAMSIWQNFITYESTFATQRPNYAWSEIQNKYSLPGSYTLTLDVSNPNQGYIKVNTIDIKSTTPGVSSIPYPWSGKYFKTIPIQLHPKALRGYKFDHWEYNNTIITDSLLTINVTTANTITYKAVFSRYILSPNPTPAVATNINACGYNLKEWSATSPSGTYPTSMAFVYMVDNDPLAYSEIGGLTTGAYNLTSKTRINGLGANGIAFINTGSGNTGYLAQQLGGAILAINTTGKTKVKVKWTGRTIVANSKQYRIRLQARLGDQDPFTDLLDANGQPIEYVRNATAGHSLVIDGNTLPTSLLNQPYVQLMWRYYYTGVQSDLASGNRDQLAIDDISITSESNLSGTTTTGTFSINDAIINSTSTISSTTNMTYQAGKYILLTPNFKTENNTVFLAQIAGCN